MKYIPSQKLNETPIKITLSGIAVDALDHATGREVLTRTWEEFFWDKLAGSGVSHAEVAHIADAFHKRRVTLIGEGDERRAYIDGKLVETPTQHIIFVGHATQPFTQVEL